MGSAEASTRRRVKLYMLNDERQWDDKGTGHVSAVCTEQDNMALVVISETDGSYLLESKIQPDTAYQKQQETLIVWSEGENMDLALSFQEKVGCDDVWEKICAVQGKDPSVEITQEVVDESDDADDTDGYTPILIQSVQPLVLPPCEFSHLEETSDMVSQAVASPQKRERLVALLESTNYLGQLVDLFHKAEDLEDMESLHHLYEIMRQFVLINKHSVYETLFADDMLMEVIGMLEYSPSGRTRHREFLLNKAAFKEVLPLHNSDLTSKIHQTYRVQYIQECCLPPPCLFDEHTLSQLKTFISLNKLEIIRAFQDDEEFMCRLFARLKSPDTDLAHRRELSLFVKEFCNISIQTDQKESFLSCLFQHGALRTAEVLLVIDDKDIKAAALEILQAFVEHQPSVVRGYVYRETAAFRRDDELLINLMINQLLWDSDPELSDAILLGYMLRILIDPDNMNNPGVRGEKTEFLSFFYKRCIGTLVRPLFDNTAKDVLEKDDYHTALVLNHILELLTFCIETHTYHMKNYCFNRDLLKRVLVLLQSSHKFLALAALRLLRRVIHMKEEFYNRYLIKNNLLKPVIKLFVANGHRYNLIDSAIIELFDYIRSEEIASLVTHVIENFWDILKNVNYVQTFNDMKRVYDHSHRPSRPAIIGSVGQQSALDVLSLVNATTPRFQRDPRSLEMEEEQWFDQDDEEEDDEDDNHLFSPQTTALVNGTANGNSPSGILSPTCLPEGISTVPHFDTHPSLAVTTSSEFVGLSNLPAPQTAFTSLRSTIVSTGSNPEPPSPHGHVFSPSSHNSAPIGLLKSDSLKTNELSHPVHLSNRIRSQQIDGDDNLSSNRPSLSRHSSPISIHLKSAHPPPLPDALCSSEQPQISSFDVTTGARLESGLDGLLPFANAVCDVKPLISSTCEPVTEDTIPADVLHHKRGSPTSEPTKNFKRFKKSRHATSSPIGFSSEDPIHPDQSCSVDSSSEISDQAAPTDPNCSGLSTGSDGEEDASTFGLVDYSDEESDDEEALEPDQNVSSTKDKSDDIIPKLSVNSGSTGDDCEAVSSQSMARVT
ncbi:unnamed protein product [Dicrocoelium dendriticum]|nr:unnamed protein product [Dicrocoelium dendriticum]